MVVVVLALEAVAMDAQVIVVVNVMVHALVLVVMAALVVVPVETYSLYIDEGE